MEQENEGATLTTERSPAEEAAAEALARAQTPPEANEDVQARASARRVSERMAASRDEGSGDVRVVHDEYRDSVERVREAAPNSKLDQDDIAAATEWLLSDEQVVNTRKLQVRVGGSDESPVYVGWVIGAVDVNVIRAAEREAMGNRAQRRNPDGGYDELKANLRVVAEGTIEPPVKDLAASQGLRDPTTLLHRRFRFRSGVIANIAAQIMELSGFDTDDVRLAGN